MAWLAAAAALAVLAHCQEASDGKQLLMVQVGGLDRQQPPALLTACSPPPKHSRVSSRTKFPTLLTPKHPTNRWSCAMEAARRCCRMRRPSGSQLIRPGTTASLCTLEWGWRASMRRLLRPGTRLSPPARSTALAARVSTRCRRRAGPALRSGALVGLAWLALCYLASLALLGTLISC